jgi:serine phosphatase RsbU (regulator of sigma subunit)
VLDGRGPADVVTRLDRFMTEAEIEFATSVVVSYDPVSRVFEAVSAGHLPPLLILPDGDTRFLEMSRPVPCQNSMYM